MNNLLKNTLPGLSRVFANLSPILVLFIFGRIASTEEIGKLNYFISLVLIIGALSDFGLPEAVQRFAAKSDDPGKYISISVVSELTLTLVSGLSIALIDLLTNGGISKGYTVLIVLAIIFSASNVIIICFNSIFQKKKMGMYFFGSGAIFLLGVYYFYNYLDKTPTEAFILSRVISWVAFTILPITDLYVSGYIRSFYVPSKRFITFAVNSAAMVATLSVFTQWDSIVVKNLGGDRENGIYKSVNLLAMTPNIIGTVLATQLLPEFSRYFGDRNFKLLKKQYYSLTRLLLLGLPLVVVASLVFGKPLIQLVFNEEIANGGWKMFSIIIFNSMLYVALVPGVVVLQAVGKEQVIRNVMIATTLAFMILSWIFFSWFGSYGLIFLACIMVSSIFATVLLSVLKNFDNTRKLAPDSDY